MNSKLNLITRGSPKLSAPLAMTVIYFLLQYILKLTIYPLSRALLLPYLQSESPSDLQTELSKTEPLEAMDTTSLRQISSMLNGIGREYMQFMAIVVIIHTGVKILVEATKYLVEQHASTKTAKIIQDGIGYSQAPPVLGQKIQWLKKITPYIFLLVIRYSLAYFFCCVIYACLFLACNGLNLYCIVHTKSRPSLELANAEHQQGIGSLQSPSNVFLTDLTDRAQVKNEASYPLLKRNRQKTNRMLLIDPNTLGLQIIGTISIQNTMAIAFSPDGKVATIATSTSIIPVDVSDLTAPVQLPPIDLTSSSTFQYILFSPDAQTIFYMDTMNSIFIKNITTQEPAIQLDIQIEEDNHDILATFAASRPIGFFITSQGLYQFDIFSSDCRKLFGFSDIQIRHLKLSSDEMTLSVGVSHIDSEDIVIYIVDVSIKGSTRVLTNYTMEGEFSCLAASSDNKIIYLLEKLSTTSVGFTLLNMTVPGSPSVIVDSNQNQKLGYGTREEGLKFVLSSDDNVLILNTRINLVLWDISDLSNIFYILGSNQLTTDKIIFSASDEFVFLVRDQDVKISRMWAGLELDRQFCLPYEQHVDISMNSTAYSVALSSDGATAYVACDNGLEVFTVINSTSVIYKNLVDIGPARYIVISEDGKTAFVTTDTALWIIDTETQEQIRQISMAVETFIVSPDGKALIIKLTNPDPAFPAYAASMKTVVIETMILKTVDITDPKLPKVNNFTTFDGEYGIFSFAKTEQLLFVGVGRSLKVYDASDLSQANLLSQTTIRDYITSMACSADGRTLYAVTVVDDYNTTSSLGTLGGRSINFVILDISNYTSIKIIGALGLEYMNKISLQLSEDPNFAYVSDGIKLYYIKVTDKTSPSLFNFYTIFGIMSSFAIQRNASPDFFLAIGDVGQTLSIYKLRPQYTFDLSTQNITVGDKVQYQMKILQSNMGSRYYVDQSSLRIITMSLYNIEYSSEHSIISGYSELPSWMQFDQDFNTLELTPNSKKQIKEYKIYLMASLPLFTCINNQSIHDALVKARYVSLDGYLTSNFIPHSFLGYLDAPYLQISQDIYQMLKGCYIEMLVPMTVGSSLELQKIEDQPKHIRISTFSQYVIRVTATLFADQDLEASQDDGKAEQNSPCRFLRDIDSVLTPILDESNSTMTLQGSLFDINNALQQIIIDKGEAKTCNAQFVIDDGLNPVTNETVPDVSAYFQINVFPTVNVDVDRFRKEIYDVPLYTNSHFTIILNDSVFTGHHLKYTLQTQSEDMYWLTLSGLALSGTPPEKLWPWNYEIVITASNQYKEVPLLLTLHVSYGLEYIVKMLGKVSIVVAIWVYLNIIFNILGKKLYRYPVDIYMNVGQKISSQTIVPIACIGKELKQSRLIIKALQKGVAKELGCRSISKEKLTEYFLDHDRRQVDRQRLYITIEDTVNNLPPTAQEKIKYYTKSASSRSRRELIKQLVMNEIVMGQLNLKGEKKTKQEFMRIRKKWVSLIQHKQEDPSWHLSVDQAKLNLQLGIEKGDLTQSTQNKNSHKTLVNDLELSIRKNPKTVDDTIENTSSSTTQNNLNSKLINSDKEDPSNQQNDSNVNQKLLNDALVAHLYRQHHLGIDVLNARIAVMKKSNKFWCIPRFLAKFLKLNLVQIMSTAGESLAYGIKCSIDHGIIHFSGTLSRDFEGRTIVIQISKRRRIKRELWLHGITEEPEQKRLMDDENV